MACLQDWELGVHGIVIRFFDEQNQTHSSATFLPHIPEENSWSREETIRRLIRKTGRSSLLLDISTVMICYVRLSSGH